MNTYIVLHTHKYGVTPHWIRTNIPIDVDKGVDLYIKKKIVEQCSIDFNEETEYLDILEKPEMQRVKL